MNSRVGWLQFEVPQVREGGWQPSVFERYQRSEKALVATMREMVIFGVSTRKVSEVLDAMAGFDVSASTVSNAMKELDDEIAEFRRRPLHDREYPFLVIDARYENVRRNGKVVKCAVLIAAGISESGKREILGFRVGDSENEACWSDVLGDLKIRGLHGVRLVTSDAHGGIRKALAHHFQGVPWQRCRVHFMREMQKRASWKDQYELQRDLCSIFMPEEKKPCLIIAEEVAAKWSRQYPTMTRLLLEGVEDCLSVKGMARGIQRRVETTNMMERLMREIKRRTRVVSIFPNEASCERFVGAVLIEYHESWLTEQRGAPYISLADKNGRSLLPGGRPAGEP
jgi:transposase-like protein